MKYRKYTLNQSRWGRWSLKGDMILSLDPKRISKITGGFPFQAVEQDIVWLFYSRETACSKAKSEINEYAFGF